MELREAGVRPVWSQCCTLKDLVTSYVIDPGIAERLERGPGWAQRWTAAWKTAQADVICPVRELAGVPAGQARGCVSYRERMAAGTLRSMRG